MKVSISLMSFIGGYLSHFVSNILLPILIATIPATYTGSLASKNVSFVCLKRILAFLIAVAAASIWISIFWV